MGLFDKKITQEDRIRRREYAQSFREYFDAYYQKNREVRSVAYREMNKDEGYSVTIEYERFRQYVNVVWNDCVISTSFELNASKQRFLCTFSSLLDEMDSDDISFYCITHCATKDKMNSALDELMAATKRYYSEICAITLSPERVDRIYNELSGSVYDEDEMPTNPEEVIDYSYLIYGILNTREEAARELKRLAKKNKLETRYEKRAYRVISREKRSDLKKYDKQVEKAGKYPLKDRIIINAPAIIIAVIFCIVFAIIGIKLDKQLYADWIGKSHGYTAIAFGLLGAVLSLGVSALIPDSFYKLFVSEKHWGEFTLMLHSERLTKLEKLIGIPLLILGVGVIFSIFAFTGDGYSADGYYMSKTSVFGFEERYLLSDTEIAIIDDVDGDGYFQYVERAYAFKIDGEWREIGVPSYEAKPIIEKAVSEKEEQVRIYEYFGDIE